MHLSNCAVCGSKKLKFILKKLSRLLSSLGIKTFLNQIPLLGFIFF